MKPLSISPSQYSSLRSRSQQSAVRWRWTCGAGSAAAPGNPLAASWWRTSPPRCTPDRGGCKVITSRLTTNLQLAPSVRPYLGPDPAYPHPEERLPGAVGAAAEPAARGRQPRRHRRHRRGRHLQHNPAVVPNYQKHLRHLEFAAAHLRGHPVQNPHLVRVEVAAPHRAAPPAGRRTQQANQPWKHTMILLCIVVHKVS